MKAWLVLALMTLMALHGWATAADAAPGPSTEKTDYSVAERALFMTRHLADLKPPTTLRFAFRKSGSLEPGFDDRVTVKLSARSDRSCCAASGEFLTGPRQMRTVEIEEAEGNPVVLYFLEHDIREMQRLTKGSQNYFRKLIRMAIYQGAQVRDTSFSWKGRSITGREIAITPFVADPNRGRYEKLANKQYLFLLSSAVPGGVYGIRTRIADTAPDAPPLIAEEMMIDGAGPP